MGSAWPPTPVQPRIADASNEVEAVVSQAGLDRAHSEVAIGLLHLIAKTKRRQAPHRPGGWRFQTLGIRPPPGHAGVAGGLSHGL